MAKKKIEIRGRAIGVADGKGLAGLSVEAWGKGIRRRKAIISSVTNSEGRFSLKIGYMELLKIIKSKKAKLYFKLLSDGELLLNTSGSVEWSIGHKAELKIEIGKNGHKNGNGERDEVPNLVGGQVLREDGQPFPAAPVQAFHAGNRGVLRLGQDTTDTEGRYTIRYSRLPGVGGINLRVTVFNADGKPLSESDVIRKAKRMEIVDLIVPAVGIKTIHVAGKVTSRVSASVGGLQIRIVDKTVGKDAQLAEAVTDEDGAYHVTFDDTGPRERNKARPDLQAHVFSGNTFLAASEVRYNASPRETLDVLLEEMGPAATLRSEHETLTGAILGHFDGPLGELEETNDRQDITYLANKTGWDARAVALAALADQFSARTKAVGGDAEIEPAFFYALFRAGLPANKSTLYRTDAKTAESVWKRAISQGVIPSGMGESLPGVVKRFQKLSAQQALDNPALVGVSSLKELLSITLGDDAAKQKRFADLYTRHGNDTPKLWKAVKNAFGATRAKRLQIDGQLAYLTLNNAPLVRKLHAAGGRAGITDTLKLAEEGYYRAEKWQEVLGGDPIPPEIEGGNAAQKRKRYAELLASQVRLSFPTAVLAQMVKTGETPVANAAAGSQVHTFLTEHHGEFEIGQQPIEQYVAQHELEIDPETTAEITRIQRVYQITPSDHAMNGLLSKGLDSAYAVVRYDRERFVRAFKDEVGGEANARLIHAKAQQVHNTVLNLAVSYLTASNAPGIGVHDPAQILNPTPNPQASDVIAYATLENLFGEMDFCECEHCRSILSPAAYLVDLLLFCDQPPNELDKPLDVLLSRRPDIEHLPLTCENTLTPLPYIDLVNETLEYYVTNNLSLVDYTGHSTNIDATTEELLASPIHIRDAAYTTLGQALFPPPLPFHQPLENLRRYFDKFEAPLPKVMEALRESENLERADPPADPTRPVEYGWRDIWMEELRLSRPEHTLLTDHTLTLQQLYGFPPATTTSDALTELSKAKAFTRRVGISYEDLIDILKTRFVNPNSTLIPKLDRLGVPFSTLNALKEGTISDEEFDEALAPHLDESEYDGDIKSWVRNQDNFDRIMGLLTLANPVTPGDLCSFDDVTLRYADPDKIDDNVREFEFVRLIRFVRLWKKLGWTVEQTDKAITALYPADQIPDHLDDAVNLQRLEDGFLTLLPRLGVIKRAMGALKLKPKKHLLPLLACFAPMDTTGAAALYRQMFLSPALLEQGEAFADDGFGNFLDGAEKLADHTEILRAAFLLTEDEMSRITAALGYDENTTLTVDNITAVFRRGWMARKMKLSVPEFLLLTQYAGVDPFAAPDSVTAPVLRLIDLVHRLRAASLKPAEVLYLIWNQDISGSSAPEKDEIWNLAHTLRAALIAIESEFTLADDPDGQIAHARMALVYGNEATDLFFGLLIKSVVTDVDYSHDHATLEQPILEAGSDRIGYDHLGKRLSYTAGVMPDATRDALKVVPDVTAEFKNAVDSLHAKSRVFFDHYPELQPLYDAYDASGEPVERKRSDLLANLLPGLIFRRKRQQVLEVIGAAAKVDTEFTQTVIDDAAVLHSGADDTRPAIDDLVAIGTPGLSAEFFFRDTATGPVGQTNATESVLAYGPGGPQKLPANPAPEDTISGIWSGYIEAPENGPYGFRIETEAAATVALELDGAPLALVQDGNIWSNGDPVDLRAGEFYAISLTVENIKDNLTVRWETTERRWEVIPPGYLYNPEQFSHVAQVYVRFLKTVSLAEALNLTAAETAYLSSHPDYRIDGRGWLNHLPVTGSPDEGTSINLFRALDALLSFARIKADMSPGDERLLDTLKDPALATQDADSLLYTLARWEPDSLNALLARFGGVVADLGQPEFFRRVYDAYEWAKKLGIPAAALIGVATNEPDATIVRDMQAAFRARYDESEWLNVLRPINDEMRGLQRDSLVSYILHKMGESGATRHIDTSEKLFEFFLMDLQMEPCTLTSRVRHALSSIQLFIERCLMNIEPRVAPSSINAKHWEWMSRYRVWEANRKVFLYPENWLEPELRDDQSPFFKETMSELLQSDITEDRAASALLKYLSKLDEVAKLEPCGIHYVAGDPEKTQDNVDHVVARTAGASRKYFYRRREYGYWTPWEQIKLDIEDNPVIPVVWNGRLFIFWLRIFMQGPSSGKKPFSTGGKLVDLKVSDLDVSAPYVSVQAVLCWSEYFDGKWQSTRTSDAARPLWLGSHRPENFDRSTLKLSAMFWGNGGLRLIVSTTAGYGGSSFFLYNTHSAPELRYEKKQRHFPEKRTLDTVTNSLKITYSGSSVAHPVLETSIADRTVQPRHPMNGMPWDAPFFYEDSRHVFYVTTAEAHIRIAHWNGFDIGTYYATDEFELPPLVMAPMEMIPDLGDPVIRQPGFGVVDPSPISSFVTEDAYISRAIGSLGTVRFGDANIGPSGSQIKTVRKR